MLEIPQRHPKTPESSSTRLDSITNAIITGAHTGRERAVQIFKTSAAKIALASILVPSALVGAYKGGESLAALAYSAVESSPSRHGVEGAKLVNPKVLENFNGIDRDALGKDSPGLALVLEGMDSQSLRELFDQRRATITHNLDTGQKTVTLKDSTDDPEKPVDTLNIFNLDGVPQLVFKPANAEPKELVRDPNS